MIKKILSITLILTLIVGMAACGGKEYSGDYSYTLEDFITLGDYKGLEYQANDVNVTEEEIQAEINNRVAAAKGTEGFSQTLTTELIEAGDIANIDYEGKVDGVAFDGGTAQGTDLTIGSGQFIPGFEEGILGKTVGDTIEVDVTFPDPYASAELAGKEAVFTVKINSATRPIMPEYNLEFVTATTEYKTIEEFEAAVKKDLMTLKEDNELANMQNTLWDQVVGNAEISGYPEGEVDARKQENLTYYTNYASQAGMDLNSFVQAYFGMDEASFQDYLTQYSETIVDQELVMYAVAKAEKIGISDKEYKDLIALTLKEQGFESDEAFKTAAGVSFEEYAGKANLQKSFLLEKVIKFIVEEAKIS